MDPGITLTRVKAAVRLVFCCVLLNLFHRVSPCDPDWQAFEDRCYRMFSDTASPPIPGGVPQARATCRSHGGDLATIRTAAEQAFVSELFNQPGQTAVESYIGLSDTRHEDEFLWLDGSPLKYIAWNAGEPNNYAEFEGEHCGTSKASGSGSWVDVPCLFNPNDRINGIICEKMASASTDVRYFQGVLVSGKYFVDNTIAAVHADSKLECIIHCTDRNNCFSTNYRPGTSPTDENCVLNSATRYESRDGLTTNDTLAGLDTSQWYYAELQHPGF